MTALTLSAVRAELQGAGLPVVEANGDGPGLDSLCPACGEPLRVRLVAGEIELTCRTGCTRSRIADELHSRRRVRDWAPDAQDRGASPPTSWAPVQLAGYVAGTQTDEPPTVLQRSDGRALLYPGRLHALFGEPEACKGWLALHACAQQLAAGERVLYVDFEDTAGSVVGRLLALGVEPAQILAGFVYVRPEEALTDAGQAELLTAAAGATLAILDGVTEALAVQGLDLASNSDIATWLELLPRPLARTGVAVLTIDHVVKDRENRGRYAIGAQHKLAGVDVAYSVSVISPFGRGRDGRIKITVTKDRPGHVRGIADEGRVADVHLTSLPEGGVRVALQAPEQHTGAFRPTALMERVSRAIEETPGLSKNGIRQAVRGKHEAKDLALELLVSEGYVNTEKDGAAVRYFSTREYRETTDRAPVPPVCPDRAPARSPSTVPPRPSLKGTGHGATQPELLDLAPPHATLDMGYCEDCGTYTEKAPDPDPEVDDELVCARCNNPHEIECSCPTPALGDPDHVDGYCTTCSKNVAYTDMTTWKAATR